MDRLNEDIFFLPVLTHADIFFLPELTHADRLHRSTSLEQPLTADVDVTKTTFHRAQESQDGVCIQHVIFSTLLSTLAARVLRALYCARLFSPA